jgi:cytochrome c
MASAATGATKDEAVAMVKKAVSAIKTEGAAKAYAEISDKKGPFVDRDLYIVVYGLDGMVLAHGADKKRIGTNQIADKDADGKEFVKERVELATTQPSFWPDLQVHEPRDQEGRAQADVLRASRRDGGLRRRLSVLTVRGRPGSRFRRRAALPRAVSARDNASRLRRESPSSL